MRSSLYLDRLRPTPPVPVTAPAMPRAELNGRAVIGGAAPDLLLLLRAHRHWKAGSTV